MHERTSIALTRPMAYHPGVQHYVAEMRINLESIDAHLDRLCDDWSNGVDHGMDWPVKIVAGKYDIVNRAWSVVDTAFDLTGGSASSSAAGSSSCSATPASGACTRPTHSSPTSWWAR